MKQRNVTKKLLFTLLGTLIAVIMVIPFVWMVSSSFKLKNEIFVKPITWIPRTFHLDNYGTVLSQIPFPTYFLNTAKLTVIITIVQTMTSLMASYSFSKLHFPGRDKIFLVYLGTMMVPWHAIMIPQFLVIQNLHLYNTHWSLILTGAFSAFGVFLLRQNMMSIPDSLIEAAKIDGAGPVGVFLRIVIPLTTTGIATLVCLTFNGVWNDYMGPMIYLDSDELRTLQLGLATFRRQYDTNYGAIMAGTVISIIPIVIVYAFCQNYIVDGIAHTGVKG